MPYQHPFPESTVTSEWGETAGRPNPHRGRDYAPGGPPAPSIVNGTIVRSERQTGLGNVVVVRNDDDGAFIGYCHLAERYVGVGARVGVGTMVGVVGNTGTLSAGRHLHFTVSKSSNNPSTGSTIDPRSYIASGSSVAGGGGSTAGLSADTQKKYQQYLTNKGLYKGLVDGAFGLQSWVAVQTHLKNEGVYSGPADGLPGKNTIIGMQTIAQRGGYSGPLDGVWGPNSDKGLNAWLTGETAIPDIPIGSGGTGGEYGDVIPTSTQRAAQEYMTKLQLYSGNLDGVWGPASWTALQKHMNAEGTYSGPADGVPGPNSFKGLQGLAAKAGYTGPIDGVFGPKSNEGLSNYFASKLAGGGVVVPPKPPAQAPGIPVLTDLQFGVDIARYQEMINIPAFYAGGGKFTIFKCGGSNDGTYTDREYVNFITETRDVPGHQVGHYWFNGRSGGITPMNSAHEFLGRMLLKEGDIIALDIEHETATNTQAYTPDEAWEFVEAIQDELGEWNFVFHYMSSSLERSSDWSRAKAAGHPLWAAAYNSNDGTMNGGGPNLADAHADWTEYQIWQYASSVGRVPGYGGDIDMNVAKLDTWQRFGYKKATEPTPEPVDWEALYRAMRSDVEGLTVKYPEYA